MSLDSCVEKYDSLHFRRFTKKAEVDKAIHTLEGIVKGIAIDNVINVNEIEELQEWCNIHINSIHQHPFSELIPLIESCLQDNYLDKEEQKDILWFCNNYKVSNKYYNVITSDLQRLQGIFHGIMADNTITDDEVLQLEEWINTNTHLMGCYPYDEINTLLTSILKDGIITNDEKNMLKVFFNEFIDTNASKNIDIQEIENLKKEIKITGLCATCPDIEINNKKFCFTGKSSLKTRSEIKEIIENYNGLFTNSISKKVNYLIVGNDGNPCWAFSCYGRKVEKAINLRKAGHNVVIVHENDFWDMVEDLE